MCSSAWIALPAKIPARPKNFSTIFKSPRPPKASTSITNTNAQPGLIEALKAGARIAVVTDAGMPGISDPGSWLAAAAIAAGIPVFPIPGANAALSALVASGLPTSEFHFLGFLPEKAGARRTRIETLAAAGNEAGTLLFYEAPAPHSRHARPISKPCLDPICVSSWPANSPSSMRNFCAGPSPMSEANCLRAIACAAKSRCWCRRRRSAPRAAMRTDGK